MNVAQQMKSLAEDIVSSYESRINAIENIITSTQETLQNFRDEKYKMSEELKDRLANHESLRKKDFDLMMKDILSKQDERVSGVKSLLAQYLNEQKELAKLLRETLIKGESMRLKEFKYMMKEIQERQKRREEEVKRTLQEFKKEQDELRDALKEMLAKGEEIRIKDFKMMLKDIRNKQKQREKEVGSLLDEYQTDHKEASRIWRDLGSTMDKKRVLAKEVMGG